MKDAFNYPGTSVSTIDREVFDWHNKLRKDPKCILPQLK